MTDHIRTLDTLERVGGALCLDFVNTINSRYHPEHDYLTRYADLIGWAALVGMISRTEQDELLNIPSEDGVFSRAVVLRDLLYRLFVSLARHADPDLTDLDAFTALYAEALAHSQLLRESDRFVPMWQADQGADRLLWQIAYSAGELLFSDALPQIKECPGCGWLFLDTSKNQSRRWCSMNTCGARSKMRTYHGKNRD